MLQHKNAIEAVMVFAGGDIAEVPDIRNTVVLQELFFALSLLFSVRRSDYSICL